MRADRPTTTFDGTGAERFNSDAIAETLRSLGLDYLALNPGASYRGLQGHGRREPDHGLE